MKRRERLDVGVLHQVFGVGRVAGHAQRGAVELIEVDQGIALEAQGALGVGLGGGIDRGTVTLLGSGEGLVGGRNGHHVRA